MMGLRYWGHSLVKPTIIMSQSISFSLLTQAHCTILLSKNTVGDMLLCCTIITHSWKNTSRRIFHHPYKSEKVQWKSSLSICCEATVYPSVFDTRTVPITARMYIATTEQRKRRGKKKQGYTYFTSNINIVSISNWRTISVPICIELLRSPIRFCF